MGKPFIFGTVTEGETFTDREKETNRLLANFNNGINTILISPRRWGKTSLVQKVIQKGQSEKLKIVYLDVFPCRTENEFYEAFTSAVLKQTSSKIDEWFEYAKSFLSRIAPKITFGVDSTTDVSISLEINKKNNSHEDILQLPEKIAQKKGIRIVVCMDEFQQISEFPDSVNFQKKLRSIWQRQTLTSYCLFGSKMHLMNELFEKKNLPFYKFGDTMYLSKISTEDWIEYIQSRFSHTGKYISKELAQRICETVENHSSYVQQFAWLVWVYTDKNATESEFEEAYNDLIDQNNPLFEKQTEKLSAFQINFLRAVVNGVHGQFTSQKIIQEYQLGSSANVSIVKKALIKKELIEIENKTVVLADPVMGIWFKREFKK